MPELEPTLLLLVLVAALLILPAALLYFFLQHRHRAQLRELTAELRASDDAVHELQLNEARLQARLQASTQLLEQALDEIQIHKQQELELRHRFEQLTSQHQQARALLHGQQSETAALRERLQELRSHSEQLQQQLIRLQTEYQHLDRTHTALQTELEQRELQFSAQVAQLESLRGTLGQEFENLAHRIFEEKGRSFSDRSQAGLEQLLQPFRQQIDSFQQRVNQIHDAALRDHSTLNAEIGKVLDIGLQMSQEASNLTNALKGNSQQRGAWGEAQLRRTLELSGLVEDAHFAVQSSFRNEAGQQRQTDYLIKLPHDKHIIIDSKVSLLAYDRAIAAATPAAQQQALSEHVRAVRQHIDELASKDYTSLNAIDSPNFVLMFMPIEPAYIDALKHGKDLFDYGYRKGIVLVSHTTLIPILRTVANLWMVEHSNREAREISARAGELYNQVSVLAERLGKLGTTLGTASKHYNDTVLALTGQQGLYGKVSRFGQLSTKVSKSLPALEPAALDFDIRRLDTVIGPEEDSTPDTAQRSDCPIASSRI